MPLLKTKALPVSDVPNCESWVKELGRESVDEQSMHQRRRKEPGVREGNQACQKSRLARLTMEQNAQSTREVT
jgi:hypothetical protein